MYRKSRTLSLFGARTCGNAYYAVCMRIYAPESHIVRLVAEFDIILDVIKRNPLCFHSISCKNNGFLFTIPNISQREFQFIISNVA